MRRWLPLLAALSTAACLIIPTAPRRLDRSSRRPIRESTLEAFRPGETTRADVLLGLGAPELTLDGERILIYQWGTQSGLIGSQWAAAPIKVTLYDHLFEFDDRGRLVRSGEMRELLKQGWWSERMLPAALPAELPIGIGVIPGRKGALRLEAAALTVEQVEIRPCCYRILPGGVERLSYRSAREGKLWLPSRPWDLVFVDDLGERQRLRIHIAAADLLQLVAYLRRHSPAMTIQD